MGIVVGTEDAFMVFQDDAVTFGSLTYDLVGNVPINVMTPDNFTLSADVEFDAETGIIVALDDGTNDGTMTFTNEGTVILEGPDGTLTINDVTYNYTQDAFVIMGDLEFGMGCDIFIAFNLEGFVAGSEECDFLFGAEADADADTDDNGATDAPCETLAGWCAMGGPIDIEGISFEIFCGLLPIADPDDILDTMDFTGFIPTDEAFEALYDLIAAGGVEIDDSLIPEII